MRSNISEEDFFHDKAFHCLLQLLLKVEQNKEATGLHQRKTWIRDQRENLHTLMNVADIKLCEYFWQQIKRLIQGQTDYKKLFFKLHLPSLMIK